MVAALKTNDPEHAFKKACASDGTVLALAKVLQDSENDKLRENVCVAICNIALSTDGAAASVRAGAPKAIVSVLQVTKDYEVMLCGAWALECIAWSDGES